jgi:hypothetical protein
MTESDYLSGVWILKDTPDLWKAPQRCARKEMIHYDTAPKAGRDAYPCLFVDLDVADIGAWRHQHSGNSTPALQTFTKLKCSVAFTREE